MNADGDLKKIPQTNITRGIVSPEGSQEGSGWDRDSGMRMREEFTGGAVLELKSA